MKKYSSILDYQKSILSPEIWNSDFSLKEEVKEFLGVCLKNFFDYLNIKGSNKWILEAMIASSLATYFYTDYSDLDVKLFIDIDLFLEYNPDFSTLSDEQLLKWLKEKGRESYWLTQKVPNTDHRIDIYFLSGKHLERLNTIKYDSIYFLSTDDWLKLPERPDYSNPSFILEIAKRKAQPYLDIIIDDIEQTKQDCIDFLVLQDFLKSLEADDLYNLQQEFLTQLDYVHRDLEQLIIDKNAIKQLREVAFDKNYLDTELEKLMGSLNYSDGNLIFKLLQRYGYLTILVEVSKYFKEKDTVPNEVEKLLILLNQVNETEIQL